MADSQRLILASASNARRNMLIAAGLTFDVIPADIDEQAISSAMTAASNRVETAAIAGALASGKALAISGANPDALVIGSDQVLALGQQQFSKAANLAEARATLKMLRGCQHELVSAVAIARNGELLWRTIARAQLTMRSFSDEFLDDYLDRHGSRVLNSVGCYEIEGAGIQLFDSVEGDHFTIMGMPLLPLLNELRARGVVPA